MAAPHLLSATLGGSETPHASVSSSWAPPAQRFPRLPQPGRLPQETEPGGRVQTVTRPDSSLSPAWFLCVRVCAHGVCVCAWCVTCVHGTCVCV